MDFNPKEHQHNRYNPLTGEWVLVSPHRLLRPWSGQVEKPKPDDIPEFDPNNPLCPGVTRPNGQVNPKYESTYVFDNDFPALMDLSPAPPSSDNPLFQMSAAKGKCRVLCFHPKSNVTLPTMSRDEIVEVIKMWLSQMEELAPKYNWVQIFENKGEMMGCSNPHPHCQIWASSFIPNQGKIKDFSQLEYFEKYKRPLLLDYVQQEIDREERIVYKNEDWVVLVPFWATWPYETMILPKFHARRFTDLDRCQMINLACAIKSITTRYDNLFEVSFPYSMGWHGAPTGDYLYKSVDHWVFHGIYYPPLLRSATIKKFMVGYEMMAQSQRDLTPETAAKTLRDLPDIHYTLKAPAPVNVEGGQG